MQPPSAAEPESRAIRHPLLGIVGAVAAGLGLATTLVWRVAEACSAPGWIGPELCVTLVTHPPWLQLSSIVAGPAVLLTWFWREQKRRDDQRNMEATLRHKEWDLQIARESLEETRNSALTSAQLAHQSAIAARYKSAAELLASDQEMTRSTGLFALWDVARESPAHRATVSRTIAAYLQTRATGGERHEHAVLNMQDGFEGIPAELEYVLPPADLILASDVQVASTIAFDSLWAADDWKVHNERIRVDVRGTGLYRSDFKRSDLSGANLADTDLRWTDLASANLSGADLTRSLLGYSKIVGANADFASFEKADLRATTLAESSFRHAGFMFARMIRTNWYRARLGEADMSFSDLRRASFRQADCTKANFRASVMIAAVFDGAVLRGASFESAQLPNASFEEADLAGAEFRGARLGRATFTRANLSGASLSGASLHEAELSQASFKGCQLAGCDASRANAYKSSFQNAILCGASLIGTKFIAADLSGADLRDADLRGAALRDAKLTGARFSSRAQLLAARTEGAVDLDTVVFDNAVSETEADVGRLVGASGSSDEPQRVSGG